MQGIKRDAILVCLASPLANILMLKVDMEGYDEREIPVYQCLLRSTHVLKTMEIQISKYEMEWKKSYTKLLVKLLHLSRASSREKIVLEDNSLYLFFGHILE